MLKYSAKIVQTAKYDEAVDIILTIDMMVSGFV